MKRKEVLTLFTTLFVLILCIFPISALTTKIKVSTYADHVVEIDFLKSASYVRLEHLLQNSGPTGIFEYELATTEEYFDMNIFVKDNNSNVLFHERFNANDVGVSLHLILIKDNTKLIKDYEVVEALEAEAQEQEATQEETSSAEENTTEVVPDNTTTETETETSLGITGLATSDENTKSQSFFKNTFFYIIVAVILSAAIFLGISRMKRSSGSKEIKVRKLSEVQNDKKQKIEDYKQAIDDAEKKIGEAQEEIKRLKNADRIEEMKKKLIEDQKELMRLRAGKE